MTEQEEIIKEYTEAYNESIADTVEFARRILNFDPYPYQEKFLRDPSALIAACCGRQVGKTTLAAIKALHHALANPNSQVLIVSAGLRQSMILFDKILSLVEGSIAASALLDDETRTKVKFADGSTITALPCGRDGSTLRGHTADMAILDECNFIPKIVIDSVIRPTTITKPNAKIIMLSTPWIKDHPFYDAITKPDLGFTAYTWPTSMNPTITKERLELERKTIGEYDFDREYNAHFIDDQSSYFPSKFVLECADDYALDQEPKPGETRRGGYYIGIDFGKLADHSALAITQEQRDHSLRVVYLQEFPLQTPYSAVIGTVRNLNATYQFRRGYLDETGVGEAPYEQIKEFAPSIQGMKLSAKSKEDVLGNLRLAIENRELTIPREPRNLLTQLTQQQCEPTAQGSLKFTHPTGTHDDLAWALALSVYAYPGPTDWMTMGFGVHRPT